MNRNNCEEVPLGLLIYAGKMRPWHTPAATLTPAARQLLLPRWAHLPHGPPGRCQLAHCADLPVCQPHPPMLLPCAGHAQSDALHSHSSLPLHKEQWLFESCPEDERDMGKRASGRTDKKRVETHLLCARVGAWKANTRAYSRGRFSLGSQGLVRQLLRPRNLPNRVRAGMSDGVSICMSAKDHLIPFPQSICLSVQIC